jgi:M6 family metalloprotease-like protein
MLLAQCSPAESGPAPKSTVVATTTTTPATTFVAPDAPSTTTQVVSSTSVAATTSTTDPGPEDVYLEPTVGGVGVESCQLLDQSADTRHRYHLSTGFPVETANFEPEGSFKIALIPLEFDDFRGNASDIEDAVQHSEMVSDWYSMVSDGRVSIDWQVHDSFIRVPHNLQDFALERSRSDDNRLARVAFEAADPLVDFTDVRAAVFLLPRAQQWMTEGVQGFLHSNFGYEGGFKSDEGSIYNYAIGGAYWQRPHKEIWSYWAHEMGHMFPLPDLYDVRGQWWNGVDLEIPGGPFSQFDMMANQDGPSRTLSTWLRFMMGWLDDTQVLCLDPTSAPNGEVTLVHTDAYEPGIKSVMIPLDSTRIIVIESRRPNEKFDCPTSLTPAPGWRVRTGVLVFTADMTIGHGNAFQHLVVPEERTLHDAPNCGVPPQLDAILVPGDTVTIDNVTISVTESGNYDHIKIATT